MIELFVISSLLLSEDIVASGQVTQPIIDSYFVREVLVENDDSARSFVMGDDLSVVFVVSDFLSKNIKGFARESHIFIVSLDGDVFTVKVRPKFVLKELTYPERERALIKEERKSRNYFVDSDFAALGLSYREIKVRKSDLAIVDCQNIDAPDPVPCVFGDEPN